MRELPKPLNSREHQLETSTSRQLLKKGNIKNDCARVTKAMKQSEKLSNVRSQKASRVTNCCRLTNLGLRKITEPLTKLGKEEATFRGAQKQVHILGKLDGKALKRPEMAYPDLKKPLETETGAAICTPGMMPSTGDRRAQAEAIGSHSRKHLLEEPSYEMTTQVDYDCNLQGDNKEAVKCSSTSENHKEKHSPRTESCATSLLRRTDYRNKGQGDSATPDIPREGHMGRITIRDNWWPMTQKQLEKQAWQRTVCWDRKQHATTA